MIHHWFQTNSPLQRKKRMGGWIGVGLILFFILGCDTLDQFSKDSEETPPRPDPSSNQTNSRSPIGSNLGALHYDTPSWPLIDEMKRSSDWIPNCDECDWDTGERDLLDLDERGWVQSLPSAKDRTVRYRYVSTVMYTGGGGHDASGQYIVLYKGEGTLAYDGDAVKSESLSRPGRDILEVTPSDQGIRLHIMETDPKNTGNYIRDIRVIWPGGMCNGDPFTYHESEITCQKESDKYISFEKLYKTQYFHPQYLKELQKYRVLRFTHFLKILDNLDPVTWENRPQLTDVRWTGKRGAPLELVLHLASLVKADVWFNIPLQATNQFVRNFALLALRQIPRGQKVYIEYHHEVWRTTKPYEEGGAWVEKQGKTLWPLNDASDYIKRLNWYGKRSAEVCNIWKNAWEDADERVQCVMGGTPNVKYSEITLTCPLWFQENNGILCVDRMDVLAFAPYFGHYLTQSQFDSTLQQWLQEPDGGLRLLFEELNQGGLLYDPNHSEEIRAPEKGALREILPWIENNYALAQQFQLQLVGSEGGQDLYHQSANPNPAIAQLFVLANRDARMGTLYTDYFNLWKEAGGTFLNHHLPLASQTTHGLKESLSQKSTPKFDAIMDFIANTPCWWEGCDE